MRRVASLDGLVPPLPNEALLRAQAAERRAANAPTTAAVRLSSSPQPFSSLASRLASPYEFLASITDWSQSNAAPSTSALSALARATHDPRQAAELMSAFGGPGRPRCAGGDASAASAAVSPAAAASNLRPPLSLPTGATATHARSRSSLPMAPLPPPRATREWVSKQALLDREVARRAAGGGVGSLTSWSASGVPPPLKEVRTATVGNFVDCRPTPAPARSLGSYGVPWMTPSYPRSNLHAAPFREPLYAGYR